MQYFVLDNFLEEFQAENVIDYFKNAKWEYGNRPENTCPPFWKSTLTKTSIGNIFENKINTLWDDVFISSIFANGQTKGLDSTPHWDETNKAELGILLGGVADINEYKDYTFIYSVCMEKKWEPAWGGETILLNDDAIGKVFLPKYNRAIVLDGSSLHYGKGPSHLYFNMRINVVCRLLMKKEIFEKINIK